MAAPVVVCRCRPRRGGDLQVLRAAAAAFDISESLLFYGLAEAEVLSIELDFVPALLRCVAERPCR